jgi:small subunit ribosomal protein S2
MRPYIWGAKNKIHLIDVSKTAILLEKIGAFVKEVSSNGGVFLWVGTKKAAQPIVLRIANNLKMPCVINRWIGGTLTNYDQVKKAITRLLHLRDVAQKATSYYKKKEIVMLNKEIARLEKNIGGIIDFEFPPAGIIIIDAKKEQTAIREASSIGLPIIGLIDTNTDPEGVTHIIPANDDSPKSIAFVLNYLESCAKEGLALYEEKKAKEKEAALAAKKQVQQPKDSTSESIKEHHASPSPKTHHEKHPVEHKTEHKHPEHHHARPLNTEKHVGKKEIGAPAPTHPHPRPLPHKTDKPATTPKDLHKKDIKEKPEHK